MRWNVCILALFVAILLLPTGKAHAQRSEISRIVAVLENNGVDVTDLVKRNSKKEMYYRSKTVQFISKKGIYAKQLESAFEKAGEDANSVSSHKQGNKKTIRLLFKEEKLMFIYDLTIQGKPEEPQVKVEICERDPAIDAEMDILTLKFDLH